MDGITPGGAPPDASQPTIVCPSCGTTVAQARFCGACGADLLAAAHEPTMQTMTGGPIGVPTELAEPTVATEQADMVAAPALSSQPEAPDAAPVAGASARAGDGKTCSWCGAVNAPDARSCASCNATFPTPEGDEALERAARERIEAMQKEINNSKAHGSAWWPFRPK